MILLEIQPSDILNFIDETEVAVSSQVNIGKNLTELF